MTKDTPSTQEERQRQYELMRAVSPSDGGAYQHGLRGQTPEEMRKFKRLSLENPFTDPFAAGEKC